MRTAAHRDTPLVNYTFLGGTIMEARYKSFAPVITITTMCAEEIIRGRLEAQGYLLYDLLLDMTGIKLSMTKEARGMLMGQKGMTGLLSVAILVNSRSEAWITRFLLKFKHLPIPVKVFYHRRAAILWLGGQKKEWN